MSWYWFECPKYFSIIRIHIRISLSILFNQFLLTKRQLANVALSNFLKISKIMCGNLVQILSIIVSCTYGVFKRIILKSGKKCYLLWRVKKQQDNFCKQSKPIFTKPWWKLKLSPTQVLVLTPKYLCNRYFVIHKSIPSSKELCSKMVTKDEFEDEGTFFVNRFPFLRTIVNKKMGIWKN